MKPFFRDNMCMGNTKQELFFETRFLVCFIENHLLNFSFPSFQLTNLIIFYHNHHLFPHPINVSHLLFKPAHFLLKSSTVPVYIQQFISLEAKHDPQYS